MSRPAVTINPKRVKRLSQILNDQGLSQMKLADKIGMSQQGISSIMNGKVKLSEEVAEKICSAYPQYSVGWLLAYSEQGGGLRISFSDKLYALTRIYKKISGLSIEEQVSEMGIPYQTFSKYLKAVSSCPIENIAKIAKFYNVSADWLLGIDNNA